MNKTIKKLTAVMFYVYILLSYIYCTLLTFNIRIFSMSSFTIVMDGLCFILIICAVYARKFLIRGKSFGTLMVAFFFLACFFITDAAYGFDYPGASGLRIQVMVFVSQTLPAIVIAVITARDKDIQKYIKKFLAMVGAIFTAISCMVTVLSQKNIVDIYNTKYGFDYNSLSYMTSFASIAILLWWLLRYKDTRKKKHSFFAFVLVGIDAIIIFVSGGKGAFVSFIVVNLYILFSSNDSRILHNRFIKLILVTLVAIGGLVLLFPLLQTVLDRMGGYYRILNFIKYGVAGSASAQDRVGLYSEALKSGLSSPIVGHGIGSIYEEMQTYSHNIFLDIFVETGIVGVLLSVIALVWLFKKSKKLVHDDPINTIWVAITLYGFISAMVSGYWFNTAPLLMGAVIIAIQSMTFVKVTKVNINEEKLNENITY